MSRKLSNIFEFMALIGRLKSTERTGWVNHGVQKPESIADHMYRMATLSFLVDSNSRIDKDRCIKMSLVHDMAESIVGDITPADGVSKEEKYRREKEAMDHIAKLVGEEVGKELVTLWEEFEAGNSVEAKFVKDLDKFDMILQAYEYEQAENRPRDLQDFFNSTAGIFENPQVQRWVQELLYRRDNESSRKITDKQKTDKHQEIDAATKPEDG